MSVYLHQLKNVPEFLKAGFADHTILAIIGLVLFVLALVFTHRLATDLRYVVVIILIALLIFAWVFKKYTLFWSAALGLLIMFVVRFIMWAIKTGRQNRINRRIEERALAKAAARRGNWQNKKGYSGASRPIHREYNNTVMSKAEINDLIKNETSELPIGEIAAAAAANAEALAPAPEAKASDESLGDTKKIELPADK